MDARSIDQSIGILNVTRERLHPAAELLIVVGLLEAELWSLRAIAPAWLNVLVYSLIVATLWLSYNRRQKLGSNPGTPTLGLIRSWVEVLGIGLVLSIALVAAARLLGDANETFEFVFLDKPGLKLISWLLGKFAAALGQQLALQLFLWPVCFEITRNRLAGAILASTIFGLIHLPSPTLVAITSMAGFIWILVYQRTARLAPLVVSHMILATLAHGCLPERLTYDMRVGLTATADMKRFEELKDPKIRLINRRLKDNRSALKTLTSQQYFDDQGGTMPGFVQGLFRDLFDRPATAADLTFWTTRKFANPRNDIVSIMLASDEYAQIRERRAQAHSSGLRR